MDSVSSVWPLLSWTLLAAGLVALAGCTGGYEIEERRTPLQVGDATVDVVTYETGAPGLTYINLHDDENTSVEAGLETIRARGGRLVALEHGGERNIQFALDGTRYTFDPNRMFTDVGADTTLARLGPHSPRARAEVRRFADAVLALLELEQAPVILTLHNNTDEHYSALSYVEEGDLAADARFVHIAQDEDPDDFFFVTEQVFYDRMRNAGFNVVFQDNAVVTDDGSLSVYAGDAGIPYINAEAQHGHNRYQQKMLAFVQDMLEQMEQGV